MPIQILELAVQQGQIPTYSRLKIKQTLPTDVLTLILLATMADLTITIEDVNEAPTVSLVGSDSNFSGSTEGVGALSTYISVAGNPYQESVTPLATDGAKKDAINIRINDEDSDQTAVGEISLTVAPSHRGITDAFSIQRPSDNDPDGYELVVNTTLLDYEEFSPAQLTADDKAIYQITITARDNRSSSLASTETFNFEVVDVQYPPVFVDPSNIREPLSPSEAFVKETNIINGTAGTPLYLLSGVRAFERHRIGRLAAVDPETGNGAGIVYTIVDPRSSVIHSNLQLIGNNFGRRLIVAGGGLTETTAATTVNLQVASPSGATRTLDIDLVVDNSRYADEDLVLNPTVTPEITFDSGISLVGSAAEESPASDNTIISFRNTAESPPELVGTLSGVIINNNLSIPPTFALLPASAFNGIASFRSFSSDINQPSSSSNLGVGIENFVINSTDGRISVRPGTAAFTFPAVFTLPVLVTPAPARGAPRFIAGMSDITIVTIATTDVNTPPQASAGRTQLNLTNKLTAQVNENLPAMTELARFTITDDNQAFANGQPTVMFSGDPALSAAANALLLLDLTKNTDGSTTASISSRIEFDYENPTHRSGLQNLVIRITDAGSYTLLDPTTLQLLPAPISIGATNTATESLEVAVDLTLQDAIEAPILEAGSGAYSISESAGQGDSVADASNPAPAGNNQVVAMLSNPLDFPTDAGTGYNASRINFSVSGRFAGILEVAPVASPDGNGMLALGLTVADPVRLENLGDGLTFPVTIVATADSVSGRTGSVSIDVTILDDPANSNIKQAAIDTALANLGRIRINEQDVVGRRTYSIPAANFSISLTDLAADADEFFQFAGRPTTRRLVVPELALEAVAFATSTDLNPNEFVSTANILNLELGRDNIYRLSIGDTNFVEKALFGDLTFNLVATSPADSYTSVPRGTIAVTPATPKNVVYAAADTTTPATPPVYALSYTQTNYVLPYNAGGSVPLIPADATVTQINSSSAFSVNGATINGVAADFVNISATGELYPTVDLGSALGNFIARDLTQADGFIAINNRGNNVALADAARSAIISFTATTVDLSNGVDILQTDASGNLVDASAEFNAYFDLVVNNGESNPYLNITQKVFINPNNSSITYNALDTLQLYEGATTNHTLNYFIVSRAAADGLTDASNYALAQFSVAVAAVRGNINTEILRVSLVRNNLGFDANIDDKSQIVLFDAANVLTQPSIDLNEIAVNSFSYDLLVEFSNPDAQLNQEIASAITLTLPQGSAPTANDPNNAAADGGLIDLKLLNDLRTPAAATADRIITDSAPIAGAAFVESEQTYMRRYHFALAQNLYGDANIIISVQDLVQGADAANNLGLPNEQVLSLRVNPPSVAETAIEESYSYSAVTFFTGDPLTSLTEDAGPLNTAGAPDGSIRIRFPITGDLSGTSPGVIRSRTAAATLVTLTSAAATVATGQNQNPLGKNFITAVSSNTFTYVRHGWGVQSLGAMLDINEPRGFSADIYTRQLPAEFNVVVTNAPDATIYDSRGGLGGFVSNSFADTQANLVTNSISQTGQNILFQDDDLLFDDLGKRFRHASCSIWCGPCRFNRYCSSC